MIHVRGLKKFYSTANALNGIDMDVERGEWVCIMGPSGSGKSTLLNIIGGLDKPSSGEVIIGGTDICKLNAKELTLFRRNKIGFVFQQSYLIPYLDATENVMLAQYLHSVIDVNETEDFLRRVGLSHRLHHLPSQLSGGEQQRVCIARALINNPEILLTDEPTGNLDRENTKMILELLRHIHSEEKFTIIIVTHDPYVSKWADRILYMEDGRIIRVEKNVP